MTSSSKILREYHAWIYIYIYIGWREAIAYKPVIFHTNLETNIAKPSPTKGSRFHGLQPNPIELMGKLAVSATGEDI